MRALLFNEKFPYFLTVLFTLFGVQINYLIRDTTQGPIIEFNYTADADSIASGKRFRNYSYEIENISKDKSFSELVFDFAFDSHLRKYNVFIDTIADIVTYSPSAMMMGDEVLTEGGDLAEFNIHKFQPGYHYVFRFSTITDSEVTQFPKVYLDSNEPVRLRKKSVLTWICRNQFGLNLTLMFFYFLLILLYIRTLIKKQNEKPLPAAGPDIA